MKRRDFLKLGLKAAALPVVLPALAKEPQSFYGRPHEQAWRPIENLEASSDPFEDIGEVAWKSWQESYIQNEKFGHTRTEILARKMGANARRSFEQIQHDILNKAF